MSRSKSKTPSDEPRKSSKHKKDKKEKHKSRDHHHHHHKSSKKEKKEENGSSSGASAKVEIPADINPNYKPSKIRNHWPMSDSEPSSSRLNGNTPKLADNGWIPKTTQSKTKVFSGRKTSAFSRDEKFPSLTELCIHVLQDNVKHIYECGDIPFYVLKPVLERAKPDDLMRIEEYNQYLVTETGQHTLFTTLLFRLRLRFP